MPTTYANGLKLPDLGSIDWFNAYKNNIDILDPIVGTVNGVATTYAPISHNHDASEITSGTIDIARLPPAALERLTTVADQTARYALTTSTVQLGDTVKQLDTGIMYLVVDTTKLNSADGYVEYSAGTASKAIADEDGTSIKTGYGKLAGNQTWTGTNTFTNNLLTRDPSSVSAGSYGKGINFYDSTSTRYGYVQPHVTTDNSRNLTLGADTGYIELGSHLVPYANSGVSLGQSSLRWSAIYADSYYYGTTAWGLNKANTWTGNNTFKSANTNLALQSTTSELGSLTAASNWFRWIDKNGAQNAYISRDVWSDGADSLRLAIVGKRANGAPSTSGTEIDCGVRLNLEADGTKSFTPFDNNINLGTSTNKWTTLNGINPGALSLPKTDAMITISVSGFLFDGSDEFMPDVSGLFSSGIAQINGWLVARMKEGTGHYIFLNSNINTGNTGVIQSCFSPGVVTTLQFGLSCYVPVCTGHKPSVRWAKPDGGNAYIYFIPCLGNV